MRLAEETKLRNQMSAKRAKAEAERKHQVSTCFSSSPFSGTACTEVSCCETLKLMVLFLIRGYLETQWIDKTMIHTQFD